MQCAGFSGGTLSKTGGGFDSGESSLMFVIALSAYRIDRCEKKRQGIRRYAPEVCKC